jgi:hypothetical protein
MSIRAFSYGGGIQSTAALVLAAQSKIDFPLFLFSNVGDDSEHPGTLRYVRDVAMPFAQAHGIELVELRRTRPDGTPRTLLEEVQSETLKSIPVPVRMTNGMPGTRSCTKHYKVLVIAGETKRRGATADNPAIVGLGISIDEWQRMSTNTGAAWQRTTYPLIDQRLDRASCIRIIEQADLPVPPKSACWFCPFHRISDWQRMKVNEPDLFMNAVIFELDVNAKRRRLGRPSVYLTRFGKPLHEVIGDQSLMDFEDDTTCDNGHCMV